jgi:hypothetical protein
MYSPRRSCHRRIYRLHSTVALGVLTVLIAAASHAAAATIRVPQDHNTIQAGIDAASSGDVVVVDAGTYKERIHLKPGITVRSTGDDSKGKLGLQRAEATIIDGNVAGAKAPGVTMDEDATLDGFSVTGIGQYDEERWKKHHATQGEEQAKEPIGAPGTAGIAVLGVTRCTVTNNIVHHIGYTGIGITGAKGKHVSPHIFRNVTYRNMGGGIGSMRGSTAIIEENICFENFYAGIGHEDANPLVINNTVRPFTATSATTTVAPESESVPKRRHRPSLKTTTATRTTWPGLEPAKTRLPSFATTGVTKMRWQASAAERRLARSLSTTNVTRTEWRASAVAQKQSR